MTVKITQDGLPGNFILVPGQPMVFTATDREPDLPTNTVVVVHYGTSRAIVFMADDDGHFVSLGSKHSALAPRVVSDPRGYAEQITSLEVWHQPAGTIPPEPTWRDVVALGPVTVLFAGPQEIYRQGWTDGRSDLLGQIEELSEDGPPAWPGVAGQPGEAPPPQFGDLIQEGARAIHPDVLEFTDFTGLTWRRTQPKDRMKTGWIRVTDLGWLTTDALLARYLPLTVTKVRTPDAERAQVGDLIGYEAAGIARNVAAVVTAEYDVVRRAVGDERYPRDDITGELDRSQEYEWVVVGYMVEGQVRGSGDPSGHHTTEGLLYYAPLKVIEVAEGTP